MRVDGDVLILAPCEDPEGRWLDDHPDGAIVAEEADGTVSVDTVRSSWAGSRSDCESALHGDAVSDALLFAGWHYGLLDYPDPLCLPERMTHPVERRRYGAIDWI